jgi:DNA-binding response OmpR family regulator
MSMPGRVLVIDDEASLRQTLTRVLQTAGCEVTTAVDGRQALVILTESLSGNLREDAAGFDLIYLDIHLPELDGMQILKEVRQRYPKLPVILLTGYGSMQSAVEALRLGATDYLLKPFDPEVLVARTRIILKEQTIERRKNEIREQIATLRNELEALERENLSSSVITPTVPPTKPQERFMKLGRLILDLQAQRATYGENVLSLPPSAFDYLVVLTKHSPEVVDYQTLVTEAQNYRVDANEARELAKWHIHVLRQALEIDPDRPDHILNVRGKGYRMLVD